MPNCPHCSETYTGDPVVCPNCHQRIAGRPGPASGALTLTDVEKAFLVELRAQTEHLQSIERKVAYFYWTAIAAGIIMLAIAAWLLLH